MPYDFQILATVLFAIAVLHTFLVQRFRHLSLKFPEGSVGENFFHLLGEVETVFGIWAGVVIAALSLWVGYGGAAKYVESLAFTEPAFVFVILVIASTRPIVQFASGIISVVSNLLPLQSQRSLYASALVVGPLLGSLITEPAAMTVTAMILKEKFLDQDIPLKTKYLTLGTLFVNVSIGGVLTHFAAPPVVMVASTWGWGATHMFAHFGWKAVIAVIANAAIATLLAGRHLKKIEKNTEQRKRVPLWLTIVHLIFLTGIVVSAHYPSFFMGLFLFFLGVATITKEYQDELKIREGLLVGFFLAGLVVLGSFQSWWLEPLLTRFSTFPLFIGTTFLTAFTDNAALTYLGAQVPNLDDSLKYALVAGAVAGGGLTVIANAPNPAGIGILRDSFGAEGVSPLRLAFAALVPTFVAMACLWWLP